jgi:hypothetical protein
MHIFHTINPLLHAPKNCWSVEKCKDYTHLKLNATKQKLQLKDWSPVLMLYRDFTAQVPSYY